MDPRLVDLYDVDNPDGPDHDYYRRLADRLDARRIIDLGCGTGILTVTLARQERQVVGIDPDAAMLAYARRRAGAENVTWILGDSASIGDPQADYAVMSGNVAQHIVGDDWYRALDHLRAGLRSGGVLAFESRNPAVREWESWTRLATQATRETAHGGLTEWLDLTSAGPDGLVTFEAHNVFDRTGEHVVVSQSLAFRDLDQITADLGAAGFAVAAVWGGWRQEAFTAQCRLMVIEAVRL